MEKYWKSPEEKEDNSLFHHIAIMCGIFGGTSLVVYPAAGLVREFRGRNLVLINREPTGYDDLATLVVREPIGAAFGAAVPG